MRIKSLFFFIFLLPLLSDISGYLQVSSYMSDFNDTQDLLQLARIRIKFETSIFGLSAKLHLEEGAFSSPPYYQPLLTGSFLDEADPLYFYKGENERVYAYMDRASLGYEGSRFSFTVGRDRFPWGKARLFSVLDLFNPYEPFALSKEERQGVNGARARMYFSGFSWAEAVYVKRKAGEIYGTSVFFSISSFDFQLGAGRYLGAEFLGGAFEGDFKGVGLRGEILKVKGRKAEYTLGFDFQANPKVYVLGEFLQSRGTLFPEIKLYTLSSSLELTPLLKLNFTGVYTRPEGKIAMISLTYSLEENLDLQFSLLYSTEDSYWVIPRIIGTSTKFYF